MESTMQSAQLGVPLLLRHIHQVTQGSRVYTTSTPEGVSFEQLHADAGRLANALRGLGLQAPAVIGTFCSSNLQHLTAYLGIPGAGFVLHTVNVRLHDDQILQVIHDGGDEAMICDAELYGTLATILPACPRIKVLIVNGEPPAGMTPLPGIQTFRYAQLLDASDARFTWEDRNETDAAVICHTGGTTGNPKGVVYSHRSLWLQALSLCTANSLAISGSTRLLPAVPLYHVNGWGLPYAALMAGADIVLPDRSLHPDDILTLIERHQPDLAAGVPTIWFDVLRLMGRRGLDTLGSLKEIASGGAVVPHELIDAYAKLGIDMYQAWGMTETSSMSAIGRFSSRLADRRGPAYLRTRQGRISAGLEIRLVGEDGQTLAQDGVQVGEIEIKGPWVTRQYLGGAQHGAFDGPWLRTGDLGTIDEDGCIGITDRVKDAIKSGGEWISSMELERAIRAHPDIVDVAIIGVPDPRWQERPAAVVVAKDGATIHGTDVSAWLNGRIARWWIPDRWITVDQLPRTSVGKINKKQLRELITRGELTDNDPTNG